MKVADLVEIFEESDCKMWLGVNLMEDVARKNSTEGRGTLMIDQQYNHGMDVFGHVVCTGFRVYDLKIKV